MKTFDYINRVVITLPLSVYEGTWTTLSPLVAMHHLDRSCVCVGIFSKLLRSPTISCRGTFTKMPPLHLIAPKSLISVVSRYQATMWIVSSTWQHDKEEISFLD